jgi:hypothetical protein
MRIRCKNNDLASIEASARERLGQSINRSGPDYGLELDAEYFVYAIEFMRGGIWVYIETPGRDYPFPYPIEFFEIVDSSIPSDWAAKAPYRNQHLAIVGFREWVNDPTFYEKLLDDSPIEISVYESKKK